MRGGSGAIMEMKMAVSTSKLRNKLNGWQRGTAGMQHLRY